jgi:hypothetical protein
MFDLPEEINVKGVSIVLTAGDSTKMYSSLGPITLSGSSVGEDLEVVGVELELFNNLKNELITGLKSLVQNRSDEDNNEKKNNKHNQELTEEQLQQKLTKDQVVNYIETISNKKEYNNDQTEHYASIINLQKVVESFKTELPTIQVAINNINAVKPPSSNGGKRSNTNKVTRRRKSQPKKRAGKSYKKKRHNH